MGDNCGLKTWLFSMDIFQVSTAYPIYQIIRCQGPTGRPNSTSASLPAGHAADVVGHSATAGEQDGGAAPEETRGVSFAATFGVGLGGSAWMG